MKQLGNLVMVCAQRRSVEFWMENGEVRVTFRAFPGSVVAPVLGLHDKRAVDSADFDGHACFLFEMPHRIGQVVQVKAPGFGVYSVDFKGGSSTWTARFPKAIWRNFPCHPRSFSRNWST